MTEIPVVRSAAGWASQSASAQRKATPIFSGCMRYFPLALAAVARLSKLGNDKHNPGEPLHWSRDKSNDHGDCIARHQIDFDAIDPETGEYHAVAVAWRALAQLELLEESKSIKPLKAPMCDDCGEYRCICKSLTPDDRYNG